MPGNKVATYVLGVVQKVDRAVIFQPGFGMVEGFPGLSVGLQCLGLEIASNTCPNDIAKLDPIVVFHVLMGSFVHRKVLEQL
jgi:hypothetical protein